MGTDKFKKVVFGEIYRDGKMETFVQDIPPDGVIVRLGSKAAPHNIRHVQVHASKYQRRFTLLKLTYEDPYDPMPYPEDVLLRFTDDCTGWIEIRGERQTLGELKMSRITKRKRVNSIRLSEMILTKFHERSQVKGDIQLGDVRVTFEFKDIDHREHDPTCISRHHAFRPTKRLRSIREPGKDRDDLELDFNKIASAPIKHLA